MLITNIFNILGLHNKVHESCIGYCKDLMWSTKWCAYHNSGVFIVIGSCCTFSFAIWFSLTHIWSFPIKIKHHERRNCLSFLSSTPKEVPDRVCTQNMLKE